MSALSHPKKVNATMTVHGDIAEQTIDGFGASGHSRAQSIRNMPEPARSHLLDLLFDRKSGIGLTILRSGIGDGGKQADGTLCCSGFAIPSIEPEEGAWNWSEDDAQIWLMREARKRGVSYLFSSAWSPPYWMKNNNSVIDGGSLRPDKYQAYADYLAAYVKGYAEHFGIVINGISPQNEPTTKRGYPSAIWTPEQYLDFVKHYLEPTFAQQNVKADIVLGEMENWSEAMTTPTLNDPVARNAVAIIASHNYNTGFAVSPLPVAMQNHKKIWMTEVSNSHPNDSSIVDGLKWAKNIHDQMTIAQSSAWLYWRLVNTTDPAKETTGEGLIDLNPVNHSFSVNKRFYTLGNYSKFVLPGYVHIGMDSSAVDGQVLASAYKDPKTGRFIIVMINNGNGQNSIQLVLNSLNASKLTPYRTSASENLLPLSPVSVRKGPESGQYRFTAILPAQSVTTFVSVGT